MTTKIAVKITEMGIKKGWLANEVGIAPGTLTKIIKGESIPTLPVALRIADKLNTSVEELWGNLK
ncbi:helix-turn-helix transcriptional regulator [Evansella cellulosilytica]|uniref:Helix-turn-helix domain protein n=1 Tax=Evansella cellulosilytica (strain ATCC 21833 / DSM 2522 / FERM P-1141 / JCM 9156 / N-4) TaxID=649639 RepID=E6TVE7_EVAC2|nr:helix-turn-helix transcriptional regulator [Evansella cellulosilytica]ADU30964.1 helix-turn-helix domain protein [Evansella cellulosilytica DSM 2522]